MEPISMFIVGKAIIAAITHSTAGHAAAVAAHSATTAKGAYVVGHSAPAVHQLAASTVSTAHAQGTAAAIKGAATTLAEVGAAAGIIVGVAAALDGACNRDAKKAVTGAGRAAMGAHGLHGAAW